LADAKGGEQEGDSQAGGINREEKDAAGDGVAGGGESQNGGENGADAGRPAEGEREAQEEAAPDAGLRDAAAEVDVTIEPAGHRRAEKADERERKKVRSAETGKEGRATEKRRNPKSDQNDPEDDSRPEIEFHQRADEVKAKEKDQCAGDGGEEGAVLAKEGTDGASGGAEGDEDDGEAGNESERRKEETGAREFAFAELLHADAGKHGDIARNERQNAGRKKRNEPREKSCCQRDIRHQNSVL